jgi:predicted cupin superfamily sugar epimerase
MNAEEAIHRLGLQPHPEGGFYRQTFRSPLLVQRPDGTIRSASTAILFLLPPGEFSAWHRLGAEEIWHHYDGAPVRLVLLGQGEIRLDRYTTQAIVPAGVWQAACPEGGAALCGCTVAPGFEFEDFEMGSAAALLSEFPGQEPLIRQFLR